jgi:hypothetical protein
MFPYFGLSFVCNYPPHFSSSLPWIIEISVYEYIHSPHIDFTLYVFFLLHLYISISGTVLHRHTNFLITHCRRILGSLYLYESIYLVLVLFTNNRPHNSNQEIVLYIIFFSKHSALKYCMLVMHIYFTTRCFISG